MRHGNTGVRHVPNYCTIPPWSRGGNIMFRQCSIGWCPTSYLLVAARDRSVVVPCLCTEYSHTFTRMKQAFLRKGIREKVGIVKTGLRAEPFFGKKLDG